MDVAGFTTVPNGRSPTRKVSSIPLSEHFTYNSYAALQDKHEHLNHNNEINNNTSAKTDQKNKNV